MENDQTSWKKRSRRTPRDVPASVVGSGGHSEAFEDLINLVASFSEHQLDLARSTSFGVFAAWNNKIRLDVNFSKWLVTQVDFVDRCIVTGREFNIPVDSRAATRIIGLPNSGLDIISPEISEREAGRLAVRELLGIKANGAPTITAAKNALLRRREMPDTEDDNIFKAAFVVYVMAILTGNNDVDVAQDDQFWHALDGSKPIASFNWAAYTVNCFVELCSKSARAISSGINKLPPHGCILFFQALYLDSIEDPSDRKPRSTVPRVLIYDQTRIARMIMLDTKCLEGIPPKRVFGGGKLLSIQLVGGRELPHAVKVVKHVAQVKRSSTVRAEKQLQAEAVSVQASVIVASNCFKARCLKHLNAARRAIEAEACLFASSFEQAKKFDGTGEDARRPTIATGPLQPTKIFTQLSAGPSANVGSSPPAKKPAIRISPGGAQFDAQAHQAASLFGDENTPPFDVPATQDYKHRRYPLKGKGISLSSHDTTFCSKSFVTARKALDDIKIENQQNKDEGQLFTPRKVTKLSVMFQKSPWEMDSSPAAADARSVDEFYVFATSNNNCNFSVWVVHHTPNIIKLTAAAIRSEFKMGGRSSSSVVDMAFRRFKQQDQSLYGEHGPLTWRHFVETGLWLLANSNKTQDDLAAASTLFLGEHIPYEVWRCQLLFSMADLEGSWMALAWDMKRSKLTVFVPGLVDSDGEVITAVRDAVDRMDAAMKTCIARLFDGWAVKWEHWTRSYCHDVVRPCKDNLDRRAESGFTCLKFCQTFSGCGHEAYTRDPATCLKNRQGLLFDIMHIKQNMGKLPQQFVQDIDD